MKVITIISDYGWKDPYVAALKGRLISEAGHMNIVDITHEIPPFNLRDTAHIISNSYSSFPDESIHLLCVDEEIQEEKMLVMAFNNHFFIAANNGLFSLIVQERKDYEVIEVDTVLLEEESTTADVYSKIAGHLSRGGKLNMLGRKASNIKQLNLPKVSVTNNNNTLIGSVSYVDHFGNGVTNISRKIFEDHCKGRNFEIKIAMVMNPIVKVYNSYREGSVAGKSIAVFNSAGWLEVGVYKPTNKQKNGAHSLLGIDIDNRITINFKG